MQYHANHKNTGKYTAATTTVHYSTIIVEQLCYADATSTLLNILHNTNTINAMPCNTTKRRLRLQGGVFCVCIYVLQTKTTMSAVQCVCLKHRGHFHFFVYLYISVFAKECHLPFCVCPGC